jgi:hypothetical protein
MFLRDDGGARGRLLALHANFNIVDGPKPFLTTNLLRSQQYECGLNAQRD